jgi:hypothetical protein
MGEVQTEKWLEGKTNGEILLREVKHMRRVQFTLAWGKVLAILLGCVALVKYISS